MERRGDGGIGGAQDPQMESMFGNRDFQPLPTENPQSEEWRDLLELFKKIVLALLPVYTAFNLAGLAGAFVVGESNVIKAVILICTVLFLLYANVALMVIHAAERQTSVNAIDIAAFMVFILIEYIVPYSGLLLCKLVHVPVSIVCTVGLVLAIVIFICWCFTIKHPMIFVKYIPCIAREAFPAGQEPSLQGTISPEEDLEGHAHQSVAPQQSQQSSGQQASAGQEPSSEGTISPEEDLEGHAHQSVAPQQSQQSSGQQASAGQEPSSEGTISSEEDLEGHAHQSVAPQQSQQSSGQQASAGQEPSSEGTISSEEDLEGHAHQSVAPQQSQQSSGQQASAGQEPSSEGTISPEEDLEGHAHHSVATEQSPERQAHAVYQAVTAADTRTASTEP